MTRTRLLLCLLIVVALGDLVFRAVIPAYADNRNDFSDPYCASWLWRHGQNPYDVALATAASRQMTHRGLKLVPVYPPTAYLVISPFSLLPWKLANLLWTLVSVAAVCLMAYLLARIAGLSSREDRAWLIAACVFCAAPLHTGLHVANSSAIAICLCFLVIYLAARQQDGWAGLALAVAVCLKPQLGIWVCAFYVFRRRWRMVLPASALGLILAAVALLRMPIGLSALLGNYNSNLRFWFGPGGMNDFSSANPFRFQLLNAQVALQPLVHSIFAANVIAWAIFGVGLGVWLWAMLRHPVCDEILALSSLLMLGMIPVYHRSYDGAVALLPFAWMLGQYWRLRRFLYLAVLPVSMLILPPLALVLARNTQGPPQGWDRAILAPVSALACIVFAAETLYTLLASTQLTFQPSEDAAHLVTVGTPAAMTQGALVRQA